jgi:TolB-like protein/tRNA A-37 threonylcarbamoyl transferase component Bud32/Tfp pilus assembly protein PilF
MHGIPVSFRLQKEEVVCPQCGSEWRVRPGLCLRCLLSQGMGDADSPPEAGETLEEVLGEIEVRDTDWRLGNYQIREEIGRGGMGVVYRARQTHSRRTVALKCVLSYHADSRETLARFRRAAEAAASLDHPNILPIYEVSESEDGLPFFSMKFAGGGSLLEAGLALRNEPRRAVALMAKVARAVQYAHAQGILHRDLKPGNVMLDGRGEPMVSDFGLAKWLYATSNLTHTLTVFGTPGFIAPEQAKGPAANLTAAADVYSLGAILFNLLTGRPPFLGEHALAVIQQASEKPAPKLRTLSRSRGIDRDLENICAKCLEREPDARYCTAGAVAQELDRWLGRWPVSARPLSAPARVLRWSQRNPTFAAAAALLMALATALGVMRWKNQAVQRLPTTGIAVLPFESPSEDREDVLFADGVQDDILTRLAKIADLKVISRTSVMQYRGRRNIRQIGNALGVSHVLEGSVRKRGARLHLEARLIDTRTEAPAWVEEYDRDLTKMFAVQSEITQKVAELLDAKVSAVEKASIKEPATTDLVAYDLYNHAKHLLSIRLNSGLRANLLEAADLLNRAIARDPSFFQAYCQLAYAHDQLYFFGYDHTPARLALAEAAVERAFRLHPDAGETHLARAQNLYHGHLDYGGALAELKVARQTLPNDARIFQITGYIQRRQGRWQESVQSLERAGDLDPRNIETLQQLALSYGVLRRYAEDKSVLDRALTIEPNDLDTKVALASLQFHWKADTRPIHQLIDSLRAANPGALLNAADEWLNCALAERDVVAVMDVLNRIDDTPLSDYSVHLNPLIIEGVIARMTKDDGNARAAFSAARAQQEKTVQAEPNYGPALCVLGLIDAGLGRKEEALREGRRAVELVPVEKDALVGPTMIKYLAMIAAWTGDRDLACEQLAMAVRPPSTVSYGQLKLLPFWDPLRGEPRFEEIVASLAPK